MDLLTEEVISYFRFQALNLTEANRALAGPEHHGHVWCSGLKLMPVQCSTPHLHNPLLQIESTLEWE